MTTATNQTQSLKDVSGTLAAVTDWEPAPASVPNTIDSAVYEIDVWGSDDLGNEYNGCGLYSKNGDLISVDCVRITHYKSIEPEIYDELTEHLDEFELINLNEARRLL